MTVIVLCDRGIASPKLWRQIRAQGWHPYMRYRKNVTFCAQDGRRLPAFVSRPDTAWIGRGTGTPNAKRRCTLLAVWYRAAKNPGSSSPTCHRRTPDPAALLDRTGLQGRQKPGLEVGQDQKDRSGADLPPLAGERWRRCWPWPMAPGWKTPMTAGLPQATCARRPRRRIPGVATPGAGRYGPSASSATASTGCGGCCSEDGSGAGSGCCPNLGRNPNQIWRLFAMPLPENPIHTPVSPSPPPHRREGYLFRRPEQS